MNRSVSIMEIMFVIFDSQGCDDDNHLTHMTKKSTADWNDFLISYNLDVQKRR